MSLDKSTCQRGLAYNKGFPVSPRAVWSPLPPGMIRARSLVTFDGGLYRGFGTIISSRVIFSDNPGPSTDEFEFLRWPPLLLLPKFVSRSDSSSGLPPPVTLHGENSESDKFRKLSFWKLSSDLECRRLGSVATNDASPRLLRGMSRVRFPVEGGIVNGFRLKHSRCLLLWFLEDGSVSTQQVPVSVKVPGSGLSRGVLERIK